MLLQTMLCRDDRSQSWTRPARRFRNTDYRAVEGRAALHSYCVGMFLGCGENVLGDRRRGIHLGGLCRRCHPNPTYYEVCRGLTNHAEAVEVVYDPQRISLRDLVVQALEAHDPTQGFRQGNDVGTQYRSAFYPRTEEERAEIQGIVDSYAEKLKEFGFGDTTTEVKLLSETDSGEYYLAEDEHQQYLYKVPNGYCPHHSTGVKCD